ncbi:hypothetical protein E4633_08590 [Geomonas terrae]|uniref:DUF308 domain-containing protein n=1 Tax=Geomonas terrae TaxID=2562681 RepID=A0A4S1CGZ1_9BACT|nr:hypothetical protein [Geomonas terrae]TGU72360.1 hypothetical protein E4633_08590 [Geomonas terrae]
MTTQTCTQLLPAWQSFYVMVGSAAAAVIAIQFVVITLIANLRRSVPAEALSAFATPTVVQLGSALLLSAIMSAPWPSLCSVAIALALFGLGGLVYKATVIYRARRQTYYQPERADWIWYALLPGIAYVTIAIAAMSLWSYPCPALFATATGALALLLIGIHNAWDTVIHIVVVRLPSEE